MSAISANANEDAREQPRSRMLSLALGALAIAQLFAFWMVCSQQVRRAEARSNEVMVQQMALSDCLQYIPGSTIASCSAQLEQARASQPARASVTGAMPVSYNYR